jgi:hypothetical protein
VNEANAETAGTAAVADAMAMPATKYKAQIPRISLLQ